MLILPLHKPLNRQTLPWITLALILANCWVYFAQQVPAEGRLQLAFDFYLEANLGALEIPAYIAQIAPDQRAEYAEIAQYDEPFRSSFLLPEMQADTKFQRAIAADAIVATSSADYASYHSRRSQFEALWQRGNFTERYSHRTGIFSFLTIFSSTFLHANFEHLFGNMVMLLIVGLLVEGALSKRVYLLMYLCAGIAAGLASELWRYGQPISGLGASGAIAGLMGALPVLWGFRRVRVFYWLGFYFNYVHVPALILLPIWFGKEIFSLLTSNESIGFDAHAGGMISGALSSWLLVKLGKVREDFFAAVPAVELAPGTHPGDGQQQNRGRFSAQEHAQKLQRGLKALGELDFARAHTELSSLAFYEQRLDILVPAYRAARFGPGGAAAVSAARRVLLANTVGADEIHTLHDVWLDTQKAGLDLALTPSEQLRLATLWLDAGFVASAEAPLIALAKLVSEKRFDGKALKPTLTIFAHALGKAGDLRAARIQAFADRLNPAP